MSAITERLSTALAGRYTREDRKRRDRRSLWLGPMSVRSEVDLRSPADQLLDGPFGSNIQPCSFAFSFVVPAAFFRYPWRNC
jgi:hypothetical protein